MEIEALEEMIVRQRKHIMQLQGKIEQSKHEQVRKRKPPFVTFGEVVRDERGVWKTRVQEQPGPRAPGKGMIERLSKNDSQQAGVQGHSLAG